MEFQTKTMPTIHIKYYFIFASFWLLEISQKCSNNRNNHNKAIKCNWRCQTDNPKWVDDMNEL